MAGKEIVGRGYLTENEVKEHLNKYKTQSSREEYLDKVLLKQGLLDSKTREAFQNVRRKYYEKEAEAIAAEKEVSVGGGGRYHQIEQVKSNIKKAGGSADLYMRVANILASVGESKKDPNELEYAAQMAEKAGDKESARKFYEEQARIDLVGSTKEFSFHNTGELAEKAGGTPEVYGRLAEAAIKNAKGFIKASNADPFRAHRSRLKMAAYLATKAERLELIYEVASMASKLGYSKDAEQMNQNAENLRGNSSGGGLVSRLPATAAILSFGASIFFFSSDVTGNVIGLSNTTSSWIGGILILIGLVALGLWIKSRKDSHKEKTVVKTKSRKK
ncbi:MAG: hypothetical protein WCI72_03665 [archaeon]